jgi:hypothetical protein
MSEKQISPYQTSICLAVNLEILNQRRDLLIIIAFISAYVLMALVIVLIGVTVRAFEVAVQPLLLLPVQVIDRLLL